MNTIFVCIGASACGKTTLCTLLDKNFENVNKVVTDTTRSPRKGEVDKVHYNFVSEQFFRENIDCYVEYNEYDHHLYGSNGTRIADALNDGRADVVICLDFNGAKALKNHYGDQVKVIYVHRDIEKIYAAIDERVANGEITAESAVRRKEQVLKDIECRNDPVIDFEVDNNGTLESSIEQLIKFMGLEKGLLMSEETNNSSKIEHKFYPCILLIDCSGSMMCYESLVKEKLEFLFKSLRESSSAQNEIEICSILFNEQVEISTPFTSISDYKMPELCFGGATDYSQVINVAIQIIDGKLQEYKKNNTPYCKPLILMISDDIMINDNDNQAFDRLSQAEQNGLFKFVYLKINEEGTISVNI